MEVIFRNVNFTYNIGTKNEKQALKDINLVLEKNKIHGIIGPLGSGKSTFLELMNGITKPTSGNVVIGNYDLGSKYSFNFNKFRYDVGLVYQFPEKQFIMTTVASEVAFSAKAFKEQTKVIRQKVIKVLEMVGLDKTYLHRNPFSLNGGEKRRVAIASVLMSNPKVLIMDEPTIGLDGKGKKNLVSLIKNLKTRYNKTIIIVTHDVDMLYEIVDNVVVLNDGKIVLEGNKQTVFSNWDVLNENNTPIPSIVKFRYLVKEKNGVELELCNNINDLVRAVSKNV